MPVLLHLLNDKTFWAATRRQVYYRAGAFYHSRLPERTNTVERMVLVLQLCGRGGIETYNRCSTMWMDMETVF